MSGLFRNLATFIQALFSRGAVDGRSGIASHYRVTPFDCGTRVLKSDRYLQLAEAAQIDFLVRTRLFGKLLRGGVSFVNASQLVKFMKPIGMFARVRVETAIVCADERCAYFSHALFVGGQQHAQVLVKMKFKKGPLTVPPAEVLGACPSIKPLHVEKWDQMLEVMS